MVKVWQVQLNEKRHSDMLEDVKRMLAIRREHQDLIRAIHPGETDIKMKAVPVLSGDSLPVPYVLSNGKRALLVVGNPMDHDVDVEFELTLDILGLSKENKVLRVTNLWPTQEASCGMSVNELLNSC